MKKNIERKIRIALISFATFSFFYSIFQRYINEIYSPVIGISVIVLMSLTSALLGPFLNLEIEVLFVKDWDWQPSDWFERFLNDIWLFLGVFALFYMNQLGIMNLFFSDFKDVTWFNMKAYHLIFTFICILAFSYYRHFVVLRKTA